MVPIYFNAQLHKCSNLKLISIVHLPTESTLQYSSLIIPLPIYMQFRVAFITSEAHKLVLFSCNIYAYFHIYQVLGFLKISKLLFRSSFNFNHHKINPLRISLLKFYWWQALKNYLSENMFK